MKKSWLILSYFAHVNALAPSHHIDDRMSHLAEHREVVLISSPCGPRYDQYRHTRVPSPAPSGIRYEVRYFLRRKTSSRFRFKFWETLLLLPVFPLYFIEKLFLKLDTTWSWFLTATPAALAAAVRHRPEVIYSTSGPVSAHLAAMITSRLTGIPYISEFQDPLVHQYAAPSRFERHFIRKVEDLIFDTARAAVFLTRKAADEARSRHPGKAESFTVYAGAPARERSARYEKGSQFVIAHFGSLGGTRNLSHFLDAWSSLIDRRPELMNTVRLHLYGNTQKWISKDKDKHRYAGTIIDHGKVLRDEALAAMTQVDALLLIQNTDDVSFVTIPSKVYEYLHTGRPILALVYRNEELEEMLKSHGHAVAQADDPDAVRDCLDLLVGKWEQNRLATAETPSPYTPELAVRNLIAISDRIGQISGIQAHRQ